MVNLVSRNKTKQKQKQKKTILKWTNVDNLNNVRREASRNFRNTKKEYLEAKIEVLETNRKIKKY